MPVALVSAFALFAGIIGVRTVGYSYSAVFAPTLALTFYAAYALKRYRWGYLAAPLSYLAGCLPFGMSTLDAVVGAALILALAYAFQRLHAQSSGLRGVPFMLFALGIVVFDFVTNSAVWLGTSFYPATLHGYALCLSAGIPFTLAKLKALAVLVAVHYLAVYCAARSRESELISLAQRA